MQLQGNGVGLDYNRYYLVCLFTEPAMFGWCLQDSVYFHPMLNPSGAPPPGKPPMYKSSIGMLNFQNFSMCGSLYLLIGYIYASTDSIFMVIHRA
jgi:hypothetical protein